MSIEREFFFTYNDIKKNSSIFQHKRPVYILKECLKQELSIEKKNQNDVDCASGLKNIIEFCGETSTLRG